MATQAQDDDQKRPRWLSNILVGATGAAAGGFGAASRFHNHDARKDTNAVFDTLDALAKDHDANAVFDALDALAKDPAATFDQAKAHITRLTADPQLHARAEQYFNHMRDNLAHEAENAAHAIRGNSSAPGLLHDLVEAATRIKTSKIPGGMPTAITATALAGAGLALGALHLWRGRSSSHKEKITQERAANASNHSPV